MTLSFKRGLLCLSVLVTAFLANIEAQQLDPRLGVFARPRPSSSEVANRQGNTVTITKTVVTTKVIIGTSTITKPCAVPVNVTGACRRKRGIYLEEPEVLTFDDGMDELIDLLYRPSPVLGVEVTPYQGRSDYWFGSPSGNRDQEGIVLQGRARPNNRQPDYLFQHLPAGGYDVIDPDYSVIQSSIGRNGMETLSRQPQADVYEQAQPRIYFSQIASIFSSILRLTATVTVTFTSTTTTTSIGATSTVSNTFFVQKCTPSPFPYALCSTTNAAGK